MAEQENLEAVISGMLRAFETDSVAAYESLTQIPQVQTAMMALRESDFDAFYFALQYPASQVIDGLLASEFPGDTHDIRFLFKNAMFVERHIRRLIEKYEGLGCCADKSHSVMRAILKFLKTGSEISFDYTQEYTFHLPKKVFTQHAITMQYFKSLQHLHSGNPEPYLQAMLAIQLNLGGGSHTNDAGQAES